MEATATVKCLKPILKQATRPACPLQQQKHAHFPPPELEARRFSGIDYDRTPIAVDEESVHNMLPKRGCPGRTFYETVRHQKHRDAINSSVIIGAHPRKLDTPSEDIIINSFDFSPFTVPQLVHCETSESEDSEGVVSPPSEDDMLRKVIPATLLLSPHEVPDPNDVLVVGQRKRLHRHKRNPTGGDRKALPHDSDLSSWSQADGCLGGF